MPSETLLAQAISGTTNYTAPTVSQIQQDPGDAGADTNYLVWDGAGDGVVDVTFTPSADLTTGAGLQQLRVRVNDTGGTNTVNWRVYILQSGSQVGSVLLNRTNDSNPTFTTYTTATFDASIFSAVDPTHITNNVVFKVEQINGGGGSPGARRGLQVSSIAWDATVEAAPASSRRIFIVG